MKSSILTEDMLMVLMDLIGQLQCEVIVLRRIVADKQTGIVSPEQLELASQEAAKTIEPLRNQLLRAVETSSKIRAFEDLQSTDTTKPQ
jgi:hypothetical protein